MKQMTVLDIKGRTVGKLSLDESYFNGKINKALLQQVVLMYLANRRRGCASTKTRAEVRGGGRKPWRQKGTGRARVGSIRSPLWRGGGVTFGPKPRKFGFTLPKKIRSLALAQSLNSKIRDNEFVVINNLSLDEPKTGKFVSFLQAIKAGDKSLLVLEGRDSRLSYCWRNVPGVTVKTFNYINAYDVLSHKKVIFTRKALENLLKLRKH